LIGLLFESIVGRADGEFGLHPAAECAVAEKVWKVPRRCGIPGARLRKSR
jgi:hypothetical protein